jgi:hypothetical protein
MLLPVLGAQHQGQFGAAGFEGGQFRAEQDTERLLGKYAAPERQEIGSGGHGFLVW